MKAIVTQPKLTTQVHEAIVAEIAQGRLKPGDRVIQEQLAQELGVSRQPVQQALLLLRNQGLLRDAPGRGLIVAPMDPKYVRDMYDIRAMLEGLAFRRAAETNAASARRLGPALLARGRQAIASGSVAEMISADLAFHDVIHGWSCNPLIAATMEPQWIYTQRVMGDVLMRRETPQGIWDQHEAMLDAVMNGSADEAESLARAHVTRAASIVLERLAEESAGEEREREPDRFVAVHF